MNKFAMFLIAGLVFGFISKASAARPPDYVKDLDRWMGKDYTYYEHRWDPAAERYTNFENRMRSLIEKSYRDEEISRREYRNLRAQLTSFDGHLRRALSDGKLSWTEKRVLETRQEDLKGHVEQALLKGEYYPYREPNDYGALPKMERDHERG